MSKTFHLTQEEMEVVIRNYEANGQDVTELKQALADAFPLAKRELNTKPEMQIDIEKLKEEAKKSTGRCCICGKGDTDLYNDTCEACFKGWMESSLSQQKATRSKTTRL